MSRVGKLPVKVPSKVNVSIEDDVIVIKGPKGQLSMQLSEYVTIDHSDDIITLNQ
jgi:large subunit ribosomal protein L6